MDAKIIQLELPPPLYEHYKQRAEKTHRSVEDEVLEVVISAAPLENTHDKLDQEIEALKLLSDKALRQAARKSLPLKDARRAEQLHFKQQRQGKDSLTELERQFLEEWNYRYQKHILLRSQILVLLKERGHDISKFLKAS